MVHEIAMPEDPSYMQNGAPRKCQCDRHARSVSIVHNKAPVLDDAMNSLHRRSFLRFG